jgi:hypothetical protein
VLVYESSAGTAGHHEFGPAATACVFAATPDEYPASLTRCSTSPVRSVCQQSYRKRVVINPVNRSAFVAALAAQVFYLKTQTKGRQK